MPEHFNQIEKWYAKRLKAGADPTIDIDEAFAKAMSAEAVAPGKTDLPTPIIDLASGIWRGTVTAPSKVIEQLPHVMMGSRYAVSPEAPKPKAKPAKPTAAQQRELDYEAARNKAIERGLLSLSDAELEAFIRNTKLIDAPAELKPGFMDVSALEKLVELFHTAHDWMYTFGEAKRAHPKLYAELMKAYGKRNAAVETALHRLDKVAPKLISLEDDVALAIAYETKGLKPPKGLEQAFEGYVKLLEEIKQKQLAEGIFKQPFQERMIEENLARIDHLRAELKHPEKSKRVAALIAENEQLKNMRYLSHSVIARNVIESKINSLPSSERRAFLERLSYVYKKRTGKMLLSDYLEARIVTKDDIRMSRLVAGQLTSYYYRSAMKSLHEYAKAAELVKPTSPELRAEGWLNQREIGIIAPELTQQLIHPLYAQALREMIEMRQGRGSLRRQIFGMVKIGQFIKPTIVWNYNAVQKVFRGMYSLNPVTEMRALAKAYWAVVNQLPLYDQLNESNLYQFPYEVSRGTQEEQIQQWITQHNADINRVVKAFEKITDTA